MHELLLEAIESNKKEIASLEEQNALIASLDLSKPVDEDTWHRICETPLRSTKVMAVLTKNIFPDAEDIVVHANYVYFTLLGFKVQIPTSLCRGINVDTSWYHKDDGLPEFYLPDAIRGMKKYYEAVDNGESWQVLARIRLPGLRPWYRNLSWWCYYRWKKPDRKQFEKIYAEKEAYHQTRIAKYHDIRKEFHDKAIVIRDELLPRINQFSTQHFNYNNSILGLSVDRIVELELTERDKATDEMEGELNA